MRRWLLLSFATLALVACGSPTELEPSGPSVTGSWTGIGQDGFNFFDLSLALTEGPSGKISGTARLAHVVASQGAFDFVVRNGAHGHPDVLVSLYTTGRVDVNYSGRFISEHTIEGFMNGSGFNNVAITLNRAPPP